MTDEQLLTLARTTHARVHSYFIWTADSVVWGMWERWTEFADAVERREVTREDCDGFALTCLELLARAGVNPRLLRLVACFVPGQGGHAVGAIDIGAETWLLDNRYRGLVKWGETNYSYDSAMAYDEPGVWHKIERKEEKA